MSCRPNPLLDDPPPNRRPPRAKMRKNNSQKNDTTPAMIIAITIICTSPLRMCVSSWAITASTSASSSVSRSPRVNVIVNCFSFMPDA